MARILPSDWRSLEVSGSAAREIETLAALERGLPDTLTVLHGVHWTRIQSGFALFGEIDFVVLGPSGRMLLIEQKSGFLEETPEGLVKCYGEQSRKHVGRQIERSIASLRGRLKKVLHEEPAEIDFLLYCPDYAVKDRTTAGLPEERIVDGPRRGELCRRIVEALPGEPARPDLARRLLQFFSGELHLVPDTATLVGQAEQLMTRLSGGLALWARRLEFEPFRLRVTATAGSGKSQLALAVLADAARAGRRARYVCYNRPLADHIARVAPPGSDVSTFHQLCQRVARAGGFTPDFSRPDAFDEVARRYTAAGAAADDRLDELIVDEGQDFDHAWAAPLLRSVRPGGRAWWLEDPMQRLYERTPVELPGWVVLRDDTNYRTPRTILEYLNRLVDPGRPIEAASPIEGAVDFLTWSDAAGLVDATRRALTLALQARFRKQDIAIVTFTGREKSRLLPFDALGAVRLRSFTGDYDLLGEPQYTDGEVLIETVYRFKGQAAPCVILTEVDFASFDERARRKLFVGMTRASMRLFVVLSDAAAAQLIERAQP
jgi:hypothetical protein